MLSIGFNVLPAYAYRTLDSGVTITAIGTLSGVTLTFSAQAVDQGTGADPSSTITFPSPSGISDSGRALKITGGTNEVDARIMIYTDNDNSTTPHEVPTVDPGTGADGAGLVGRDVPGFVAGLFWGASGTSDYAPNTNVDYGFDGNVNDGLGEVWVVDKRHTHTYTLVTALDNAPLFLTDGTPYEDPNDDTAPFVSNVLNDGLYPQLWDTDLWDHVSDRSAIHLVSPALYKTIATVAYSVGEGSGADAAYYVCQVGDIHTADPTDSVLVQLSKIDDSAKEYLYVYLGGDFTGRPAQAYSTNQLNLEMAAE